MPTHKERCRGISEYALKTGRLKKPEHCENCLHKTVVDMHHERYDHPLEVDWLCSFCHRQYHKARRIGAIRALTECTGPIWRMDYQKLEFVTNFTSKEPTTLTING